MNARLKWNEPAYLKKSSIFERNHWLCIECIDLKFSCRFDCWLNEYNSLLFLLLFKVSFASAFGSVLCCCTAEWQNEWNQQQNEKPIRHSNQPTNERLNEWKDGELHIICCVSFSQHSKLSMKMAFNMVTYACKLSLACVYLYHKAFLWWRNKPFEMFR